MPREIVYGQGLPYGSPDEPGPARSIVEVSWSPHGRADGHVQLVTRCVRAVDTSVVYEPRPGEPGAEEDLAGQHIPRAYGVFMDLDRRGINDLVQYLRRARDQAFGKDA
jgi:hypothetical protein